MTTKGDDRDRGAPWAHGTPHHRRAEQPARACGAGRAGARGERRGIGAVRGGLSRRVPHPVPRRTLRTSDLSDTRTYCPFKGDASYWSLPDAPDLAWAYLDPKPELAEIKDHLCFHEVQVS
ncbi:hypothetical protein GCM10018966_101470 [Streptomyces yanii]